MFTMAKSHALLHLPVQIAAVLLIGFSLLCLHKTDAQTGVCYETLGDNLPTATEVVALCNQYNIRAIRLYNPGHEFLQALKGNIISVILGVGNEDIIGIAGNFSAAKSWVQSNVLDFSAVNFKYVSVGNEISPLDNATYRFAQYIVPAMQNIYNAISVAGLGTKIKVSTSISTGVLAQLSPPSAGTFRREIRPYIGPIIKFLVNNNCPLLVNIYTYLPYINDPKNIGLDYALFTAPSVVVRDGPYQYQNLFDVTLDATYVALEKFGGNNVDIVVSETGWPSAGGTGATAANARVYNNNLIQHVRRGTPRRPRKPVEAYIYGLIDEDQKIPGYGKHWGLFYPNKQPKYPMAFPPKEK